MQFFPCLSPGFQWFARVRGSLVIDRWEPLLLERSMRACFD